jgi:hypothetical protein
MSVTLPEADTVERKQKHSKFVKTRYDKEGQAPNKFGVAKRQWLKWTPVARQVFNKTYERVLHNQEIYKGQSTPFLEDHQWRVICWNISWLAADICSRGEKYLVKDWNLRGWSKAAVKEPKEDYSLGGDFSF